MSFVAERGFIAPREASEFSWKPRNVVEMPDLSGERLRHQIDNSLEVILSLQDPNTGLTSAATPQRRDLSHHMDHWWLRDQAIKMLALSNGAREITEENSPMRRDINGFIQNSMDGILDLMEQDPWQEGFGQEVVRDPHTGIRELKNSEKAPPIHARTNGDLDPDNSGEESWIAQNQPDAWGFLFQAIAQSARNGIVTIDEKHRGLLEQAVSYIDKIQPEHLRQTSMWEWTQPGLPPTSSVAAVGKGLSDIQPYLNDPSLRRRVERRVQRCRDFVNQHYPKDYTAELDHPDPIDLATLVAMGHDALDGTSYSRYLIEARRDLAGKDIPGMIRYRGDQYHMNWSADGGEAAWFMGLPYRANVFFRSAEKVLGRGQLSTARNLYAKGAQDMGRALDIVDKYGYPPELFEYKDGEYFVPTDGTSSHIGWNDAILIQAGARALKLQNKLGIS